jgi:AP-2 complex subunit mu-1
MSAEVELISTIGEKKSWNRPPIQMEFQVTLLLKKKILMAFWSALHLIDRSAEM